jgi:hypothetical protein
MGHRSLGERSTVEKEGNLKKQEEGPFPFLS